MPTDGEPIGVLLVSGPGRIGSLTPELPDEQPSPVTDDERALSGDLPAAIVEALISALTEIRSGIPVPPTVR